MTRDQIRKGVLRILSGIAPEADAERLDPAKDLRAQVELDSFDLLTLLAGVSREFGVDIPEARYQGMRTLDQLIDHIAAGAPPERG